MLYSAVGSMIEIFCRSGPSAATCNWWRAGQQLGELGLRRGRRVAAEPPGAAAPAPPNMLLPAPPDSAAGRPRSVLTFTVPSTVWVWDAAILVMICSAVIEGSEGSPASASAGTSLMVAAAMPATATGTP